MPNVIEYNGADKWKLKATDLLNQAGGAAVTDVKVDDVSVVTDGVAEIDLTPYAETADLATVATSGDYDDLINKPTIPAAQVNSDWNASSGVAEILNKPSIYTQTETDTLLAAKQNSLLGGSISSGDLDDYTTIGHYYVNTTGASSVSHLPVALAGYLEVIQSSTSSSGGRLQKYTAISSNAIVGVYERNYNNSAWQTWARIDGEGIYLPLAGGEMTGDLTIAENSPTMVMADTNIELGTNPSSNQGNYMAFADKNKDGASYIGRVYSEYRTNGATRLYLQAGNISSADSSFIRNSNYIEKRPDGTNVYSLEEPAAFRSAIGINDTPTTTYSDGTSQSVPTASDTTLNNRTLSAGVWLIACRTSFSGNNSGYRRAYLATSNTSTQDSYSSQVTQPPVNSSTVATEIMLTTIVSLTASTTIYLRCRQNSGSTLTCVGSMRCVRLNAV